MIIKESGYNRLLEEQKRHRDKVFSLISRMRDDLEKLQRDLEKGYYDGLGGSAQNSWDLYTNLGRLHEVSSWIDKFTSIESD